MIDTRADEIRKSLSLNEDLDHQIRDVFGRLVAAQIREGEKLSLNDQEIIGNAFILLFAGHGKLLCDDSTRRRAINGSGTETTAYTLSATLALLALNEEEQEIAYQHIKKTLPDDRLPVSR